MVSRTRLALIFALVAACFGVLNAEAIFLGAAPAMEIPATEEFADLPARVTLKIAVFPDSSYILQGVEPEQLTPFAEKYILGFNPFLYFEEGQPEPGIKELEIRIIQVEMAEQPLAEADIRAGIEYWIKRSREQGERNYLDPFASWQLEYRTQSNATGLYSSFTPFRIHGFDLPGMPYEPALTSSWLRSVYGMQSGTEADEIYPYEVLLTELKAGMGEYDSHFAIVRARRNRLFGKPGLYYGLDFSLSNGYWLGVNSAQTNTRHHLQIPLGALKFDLEYADFALDQSSLSLHPSYWTTPTFSYERVGEFLWAQLSSPWLDLAYGSAREELRASRFIHTPKSQVRQIRLGKGIEFQNISLSAFWHQAWRESKLKLPAVSYQKEYQDQASIDFGYTSSYFDLKTSAELNDFKGLVASGNLGFNYGVFNAGLDFRADFEDFMPRAWVEDPYRIADSLEVYDLREQNRAAISLGYSSGGLDLSLGAGRALNKIASQENGILNQHQAAPLFAGLGASYDHDFKVLRLIIKQNLLWTMEQDFMRDDPSFRGFGELELRRELKYDNAIFTALGYSFHSSYINRAIPADVLDFSLIADLKLGVKISKLFELNAGIRNLGDNYIFGLYPLPFSMYASLNWFFLN